LRQTPCNWVGVSDTGGCKSIEQRPLEPQTGARQEKLVSNSLPVVRTIDELRARVGGWRSAHRRIALVPTMGALHAGHIALVTTARDLADRVVASIFVNPRQFGVNEDLDLYPRDEAGDVAKLAAAGCDLVYAPTVETMYPKGFGTKIMVTSLGDRLCGAARPGHFDGVGIVVTKLLTQAQPDIALFGQKDWQQLAIIRRLVADLDLSVAIAGVPIVRDPDGLALSSRNVYLSPDERTRALALPNALQTARAALLRDAPVAATLATATASLTAAGFGRIDYIELVDERTLLPVDSAVPYARLCAAAIMGTTRLIDNLGVA
jgi:pantoate--beta-alanine ligase